jgi:hypothetical protein
MRQHVNCVVIMLPEKYHVTLIDMAQKRSNELGTRVSMGFVIREMMDRDGQMHNPALRTAAMFAAHD